MVPVLILVVIAIPSFRLLYFIGPGAETADMTIKAIGHQWYWTYDYPDQRRTSPSTAADQPRRS